MKKILALLVCLFAAIPVFADAASADLEFSPAGGGRFIYCNNQESVTRDMLSDKSNPNPEYIMNNAGLDAGKYALYVSLLNHTEQKNADGKIIETGFDIETDAYIKANADTVIKITALGFEVPSISETYADGALSRNEGDWSCIQAIADYTGREIKSVRGEGRYTPNPVEEITVTLKRGEVTWLSKYIKNYRAVNWLKPVHILCDFEVVSGNIDLNIAALKSEGVLGDRSGHMDNAAFGEYRRDRQYKGIADTLPYMYSKKLSFTIDDTVRDGTELPVTVYNQYEPRGKTVTRWFTHLNPLEDIWSRNICAQSDMLSFSYKDPSKLNYYGTFVPSAKRNDTWHFDVYHSDLRQYGGNNKAEAANFKPNDLLSPKNENSGSACNLGNYGVFVNYHVSVENKGNTDRYFNYRLRTTANNVVSLKNASGEYALPYSVFKGQTDEKREDTMASILLPANQTTEFYIEILLPMNNPGGMENCFMITDGAPKTYVDKDMGLATLKEDNFTGREYYRWTADSIITYSDGEKKTHFLTEKTKKAFDGSHSSYKITAAGDGYIARYASFQTNPSHYSDMLKYYKNLYILDSTFNIVSVSSFDSFVSDASYANGVCYVQAGKNYYSIDGRNWFEAKSVGTMPVSNEGGFAYTAKNGKYYISSQPDKFIPVSFAGEQPKFMENFGEYYCYAEGETLYVSKDGLYYTAESFPEQVKNAAYINGKLIVNGKYTADTYGIKENAVVIINNTAYSFSAPQKAGYVPLRETMEKLCARVLWDETDHSVNVIYNGRTHKFTEAGLRYLNGALIPGDSGVLIERGVTYISYENLSRIFDIDVSYDEKSVVITGSSDVLIDSEYYAGFDVPKDGAVLTDEAALSVAKAVGADGEITAKLNEVSGYWEISLNDEIIMVIRKSDGKIMVR